MPAIAATEFARNFGQYRELAQREPVAVTSHGRTMGYFVSAAEFEELQRIKAAARRSLSVHDLSWAEVEQMAAQRMAPGHEHLDALLDEA